jgi:hypothetical protein
MLTAPKLDYALLAPMLIILGAALIGVLIEAFAKQAWRARLQLVVALGAIVISFEQLFRVRNQGSSIAAVTSVSIDGTGIFLQGAMIAVGIGAQNTDYSKLIVGGAQVGALGGELTADTSISLTPAKCLGLRKVHKSPPFYSDLVRIKWSCWSF